MLKEGSAEDVHLASNFSEPFEIIESTEPGFAVLDVKLGATSFTPIVKILR